MLDAICGEKFLQSPLSISEQHGAPVGISDPNISNACDLLLFTSKWLLISINYMAIDGYCKHACSSPDVSESF